MLDTLKSFFNEYLDTQEQQPQQSLEKRLQMATAALLLEMANADFEFQDVEQEHLLEALKIAYALEEEQLQNLVQLSSEEHQKQTSIYPFTGLINQHYSAEQKQEVVRLMWKVALADGNIDKHEMHLMRKISDLLYIPRPVVMEIKQQVMAQQQE